MKKQILIAIPLISALGCTGLIETDDSASPSDPSQFSALMFDEDALLGYTPEDRAYVQGHALAVYLYGKTLPRYVGHRGFDYQPGVSSSDAQVPYQWDLVMNATSGGINGSGDDDVIGPYDCDPFDSDCDDVGGEECDPFDPECDDGGGEECDPFDPECDDGGDDGECDPFVEDCQPEDCEDFLNPAALDARRLQRRINAELVLGDITPADEYTLKAFYQGLDEALFLQDLNENTDYSEVEHIKSDVQDDGLCEHSPLVLDLNGDGLAISNVAQGVKFDLLDRGSNVRTAWIQDDDALLVLDTNGNGRIDSSRELFGNSSKSSNGFAGLAVLDSPSKGGNADGVLNHNDQLFSKLQVWNDANRDGQSQESELRSLAAVDIVSIDLDYSTSSLVDENGNSHRLQATFVRKTGSSYSSLNITDVWFKFGQLK
jgi:hypothetical protein